jgi:hypothetical protein
MVGELLIYTSISTVATIIPVWKYRRALVKLLHLPGVGWVLNLAYAFGMSWLLLLVFHMQSSIAGLANMLHSIVYGVWLYFLKKKYDGEKMVAAAV